MDWGYGHESSLSLNLVYNPGGPFLPPSQPALEEDYRREFEQTLWNQVYPLLTITNMPLGRFRKELNRQNQEENYLELLRKSFNPLTLQGLMCRHQITVGWGWNAFTIVTSMQPSASPSPRGTRSYQVF